MYLQTQEEFYNENDDVIIVSSGNLVRNKVQGIQLIYAIYVSLRDTPEYPKDCIL